MAAINDWMRGDGTDALEGSTNASLIDDYVTAYLQDPLGVLLENYRRGCPVRYASASTVTVGVGELACYNSSGDETRMRANTSEVTLDITADLDTGTEQVSQQYYVWAVADADATTFTGIISESATFPTGVSWGRKIGYFYNNGSGDICSTGNIPDGVGNIITVEGTSDVTGGSSWGDMTDMVVYFVATGNRLVNYRFVAPISNSDASDQYCRIIVDSTEKCKTQGYSAHATNPYQMALENSEVMTAGPHTVKVQWYSSSGTPNQKGSTNGERVLTVQEI